MHVWHQIALTSHNTLLSGGYLYLLELVDLQCLYIAHVPMSSTSFILFMVMNFQFYFAQDFRMEGALAADFITAFLPIQFW